MAYTVSNTDLVTLVREMVRTHMHWIRYQAKTLNDPVNRQVSRDCWGEATGRNDAYTHAFTLITGVEREDVTDAMTRIVGTHQNEDNLTAYAFELLEALELSV